MPTGDDVTAGGGADRGRHRLRWAAALVVLAAVGVAVALRVTGTGPDGAATGDPPDLSAQLAASVVEALEGASAEEHAHHGHDFDGEYGLVCAAETFGFEPTGATTVDRVEVVYAHHMCAEVGPGIRWPDGIRAAGPLVMDLTTEPATVRLPETALPDRPDASYDDRARALFPDRYHERALADGGFNEQVAEVLRDRFEAATADL